MKKLPLFIGLLGLFGYFQLTTSCTHQSSVGTTDTLVYEMKSLQQSINNCHPDSANCTYILYTYPLFKGDAGIVDSLNQLVLTIFGAGPKVTLLQTQQTFIHEYNELLRANPTQEQSWYSQTHLTVPYQNQHLVGLSVETDDYTGGAHGIFSTFYMNISRTDAQPLTVKKLFSDSAYIKLLSLAEKKFRVANEIEPNADLEELGYLFTDGRFYLNDNFTITPEGINWLYNPYEIAPYAQGTIEVMVTKAELIPLLKPAYKNLWGEE